MIQVIFESVVTPRECDTKTSQRSYYHVLKLIGIYNFGAVYVSAYITTYTNNSELHVYEKTRGRPFKLNYKIYGYGGSER